MEMALLSFFEQFRKIYIGDQVQKTSKVYRRLSEVLGLNDESMVLSVIIRKVGHLQAWKLKAGVEEYHFLYRLSSLLPLVWVDRT